MRRLNYGNKVFSIPVGVVEDDQLVMTYHNNVSRVLYVSFPDRNNVIYVSDFSSDKMPYAAYIKYVKEYYSRLAYLYKTTVTAISKSIQAIKELIEELIDNKSYPNKHTSSTKPQHFYNLFFQFLNLKKRLISDIQNFFVSYAPRSRIRQILKSCFLWEKIKKIRNRFVILSQVTVKVYEFAVQQQQHIMWCCTILT